MSDADQPIDEDLQQLTVWPFADAAGGLEALFELWIGAYGSASWHITAEAEAIYTVTKGRYLRLATGGWSGNEAIIEAWRENRPCWASTWRLTARGGLYLFGVDR